MKRMLCIWLPNWPIQRLANARPELQTRLLILYTPDNRGVERVAFCSPAVRDAGVHPGMPLAEAMGSV
ncbi:MAG: hypothetical protein KDA60_23265, partial [Planctomycetales bacterium]|nr:hypothetical protein [Planctomycetales bacterium]